MHEINEIMSVKIRQCREMLILINTLPIKHLAELGNPFEYEA